MTRSISRREARRMPARQRNGFPTTGTILVLIAAVFLVMNAKDLYRYLKISTM